MNRSARLIAASALVAGLCALVFLTGPSAGATILNSCAGNVCTNTVTVGGQAVTYSWTQNHNATSSTLKVRFVSGPYATNVNQARFKVTVDKPFATYAVLKNPDATVTLPPIQSVDVGSLWIERDSAAAGTTAGQKFDFTFELGYGATAGPVNVMIFVSQYGASDTKCGSAAQCGTVLPILAVQFDPASPSNRNEGDSLAAIFGASYLQCQDGKDNDLDYSTDCADPDCLGKTIRVSPAAVCESPETTCSDSLDNDGNGKTDCADPLCNGKAGDAFGHLCGPENGGTNHANCADAFDNDGNGKTDCNDDAPGTGCWRSGFQGCAVSESTNAMCMDNVDNDHDQNYSETIDSNAATGIDCSDYDCKGLGHCPANETLRWDSTSSSFVQDLSQCADGKDNDLDHLIDCADPDCIAAPNCARYEAWLPPAALDPTGVATPASYFNFCSDTLDNDGNGQIDGADAACKNKFGECGPAGSVGLVGTEDFNFMSCADGKDNDLNSAIDCADAACRSGGAKNVAGNKLGRGGCATSACGGKYATTLTDGAMCGGSENTAQLCGDGFDNNANGAADCADAGCAGVNHGPALGSSAAGYQCAASETGATNCKDGADNNGDGNIDCFDAGCQDDVQCHKRPAQGGWTTAPCITVPDTTALAPIASGGTVQYAHDDRIHVNDAYHVRFKGLGTYTSLTITLGDNANPANAFPFNAGTGNCTLSGTGAAQMQYMSPSPVIGIIIGKAGATLSNFDVTLTCAASSPVPLTKTYTIDVVAHAASVEYGEATPTVQVYENTPPAMVSTLDGAVSAEGAIGGVLRIPANTPVRLQGIPSSDPSGICKCSFTLNNVTAGTTSNVDSADGNCRVNSEVFANNATYRVQANATDGAANTGATSAVQTFTVSLIPSVSRDLTIAAGTTYKNAKPMSIDASFQAAGSSTFPATCRVYLCDDALSGACVQQAGTVSIIAAGIGTNLLTCTGTYTPPSALAGGRWWIFMEATDSAGNVVRSNLQPFLKCEQGDIGTGACKDADFDNDGAPEGRFTPSQNGIVPAGPTYTASASSTIKACDNCVNFYNPSQTDKNANGIGDDCEASAVGRCQYKTCSGTGTPCTDDSQCASMQRCIVVDQQMCTINCTSDADCTLTLPDRSGICQQNWGLCDDGDPTTNLPGEGNCCFNDADCTAPSTCRALVRPFVQTTAGTLYSGGSIQGAETPPIYNATYCLQANGAITNFTSAYGCALPTSQAAPLPSAANNYANAFGIIDVNGILGGKYGAPQNPGGTMSSPFVLNGKIYEYDSGLTLNGPLTFNDSSGNARGNGLIVVKGDLVINADLAYQDLNESDLKNLASVGWLVLKGSGCSGGAGDPGCGNVIVNGSVRNLVGAFFAEGQFDSGQGNLPLAIKGVLVAKNFKFQRTFASRTAGAEYVKFDGRTVLNPPPGMTDVSRSLPGFSSVPGQ